jgi:hypothetical protein
MAVKSTRAPLLQGVPCISASANSFGAPQWLTRGVRVTHADLRCWAARLFPAQDIVSRLALCLLRPRP